MNILLVNKYWRKVGGVEEYCFLLEEVLLQRGHQVIPFAQAEEEVRPTPYAKYFVPPVNPAAKDARGRVRAAGRAIGGQATVQALERLLTDVKIDAAHVVHAYHQLGTSFLNVLEKRGIPVVLAVHDYKLCCPSYRLLDDRRKTICTKCLDSPWKSPIWPALTGCWRDSTTAGVVLGIEALSNKVRKPYANAAGRVLVSNELMRRCAVAGGIPEDRIRIVPNFWPAPVGGIVRSPLKHMLYVGRLVVEKGVDILIRAAAISRIPVRIVGDGPLLEELRTLAITLNAPVEFLGQVWGEGVQREMLSARALVIPSVWHEVSPLVAYQAMTLKLPIIASAVGGMPDLLRDGRGFLLPHGNADLLAEIMTRVLRENDGAGERAAAAAAYSKSTLSRDCFVELIRQAYADLGVVL